MPASTLRVPIPSPGMVEGCGRGNPQPRDHPWRRDCLCRSLRKTGARAPYFPRLTLKHSCRVQRGFLVDIAVASFALRSASYLITLSARHSTDCGMFTPICFEVLRFITSSPIKSKAHRTQRDGIEPAGTRTNNPRSASKPTRTHENFFTLPLLCQR